MEVGATRALKSLAVIAALLTVWEFMGCVGGGVAVGFVLGFVASGFYEPFARGQVDHLKAAGYGSGLGGWFALVFCGFLAIVH